MNISKLDETKNEAVLDCVWDKRERTDKDKEQEHGLQGKIIQNNVSSLYVTQQESSIIQFPHECDRHVHAGKRMRHERQTKVKVASN